MQRLLKMSIGAAGVLVLGLAACVREADSTTGQADQQPAPYTPEMRPYASIQELMLNMVDPSAEALWASVSATYSRSGAVINEPKSEEDWAALRGHALILAEAGNLLIMKDRPVAVKGGKVADEGSPGILTTFQIQAQIAQNPARFAERARALQDKAEKMVQAIDRKDASAIELIGGELDEACEACHKKYWYPS
ncbi:MAG TPA: cytochrome c [Hyphomonadaceae bacterium]|nr:cytochrome c [Hyphomonadaceae bacterium]